MTFRKKIFHSLVVSLVFCLTVLSILNANSPQRKQPRRDLSGQTVVKANPELELQNRILKVDIPGRIQGPRYAPDRILVKFKPEVSTQSRDNIIRAFEFRNVRKIPRLDVYRLTVPANMTVEETLNLLWSNPDVEYANPVYRTRVFATPNDRYFSRFQYNLQNRGIILEISSTIRPQTKAGADIKATTAWDITKGDPNVIIAILDSGVDMTHVEMADKVVSTGKDFVNNDNDATDDFWHGTHVAGIAGAKTNNTEGIAGVAWNCKILPVKIIDAEGTGYYDWLIEGIIYAADNGAKVINLSIGGDEPDLTLKQACKYAFDKNVVIVASAGNDAGPVVYPAAYDDYVLAVAATDYEDKVASFSNFGPQLDVAAPGVYILSPAPQWFVGPGYLPYLFASGTSMAAPHVAGMAALILSVKPWLDVKSVMKVIRYTADDINSSSNPGRDNFIGYGRINMEKALVPYKLK